MNEQHPANEDAAPDDTESARPDTPRPGKTGRRRPFPRHENKDQNASLPIKPEDPPRHRHPPRTRPPPPHTPFANILANGPPTPNPADMNKTD